MPAAVAAPPFGTVITAMVTAFTDDGTLDLEGTVRVARHLVDHGHDGLVVNGTTGEAPTTTDEEQLAVLEAVVAAVGDKVKVVCGVGSNDTAHTVAVAKRADAAGADGLLVVTPYYNKPTQPGIVAHFRAVRDVTHAGIIAYDIPSRTGAAIAPQTLIELARQDVIAAVKDAKDDVFSSAEVIAATGLPYYSGSSELDLAHLANGAVGVISVPGHVMGDQLRTMVDAIAGNDLATARDIYLTALPLIRAVMQTSQGAIMAKAAMQELGILTNRRMRLPLVDASDDDVALLRRALAESGVTL